MTFEQPPLVVITGASAGIGAAIAKKFGNGKFRLALLARRLDRLKEIQNQVEAPVFPFEIDVADSKAVSEVVNEIEKQHGPIELLVNNAGLALGMEPANEAKLEDWDRCIDVNIKGLIHCTHAVLAGMVRHNRGHIINMGSTAGRYPYPGGNVYGATKAFVHQFSLNLRADLLGKNIRVTCIEPGMVGETEFSSVRFRGNETSVKNLYQGVRFLTAEDIAETVFFCHQAPSHMNINFIELMSIDQASGPLAIHRK